MAKEPFVVGEFETSVRAEWRAWLAANHASARGVWFISYKKASGKSRVSYEDAVEEALCFGWIDSVGVKLDEERYKQLFTPRNPKSAWSDVNKERIERLIAAGLMTPAGQAKIDAAKADGSWGIYDEIAALTMPVDLAEALAANPAAEATYRGFTASQERLIWVYIADAKRPETRQKRVAEVVSAAAEGWNALNWHEKKRRARTPS